MSGYAILPGEIILNYRLFLDLVSALNRYSMTLCILKFNDQVVSGRLTLNIDKLKFSKLGTRSTANLGMMPKLVKSTQEHTEIEGTFSCGGFLSVQNAFKI